MKHLTAAAALAAPFLLAAAMPASAQPAPTEPRHSLSDICAGGECVWEKAVTCHGFIEGLNFDADGNMWMVAYLSGEILRVEGDQCVTVGEPAGAPNGAKFNADGDLIVADRAGGIQKVDPETGTRETLIGAMGIASFRGLNDLIFAPDGSYYFTEPYGSNAIAPVGRVYYVGPEEGAQPEIFIDGMAFPNGIALSPDGLRLYVADFGHNRIIATGSMTGRGGFDIPYVFARLVGGSGPDGMTVDAAGNVYAAHFGAGEVVVFAPDGFPYGAIRLPEGAGTSTTNVAINDGYLYVTEASQNVVWRVAVTTEPLKPFE